MTIKVHELAPDLTIYEGHVIDNLRAMPAEFVQVACTSDPYWGLRVYAESAWEGGNPDCDHAQRDWDGPKQTGAARSGHAAKADRHDRDTCGKCGARRVDPMAVDWPEVTFSPAPGLPPITVPAWYGAYGLEPDPWMYVGHSVLIRRELWRVLRKDGVHWLDLGFSYNGSGGSGGDYGAGGLKEGQPKYPGRRAEGYKAKDLVPIPWMVAQALQADGWYLRSAPPWLKRNCMPESATDRPTTAHEQILLLTKSEQYYYDDVAVRMQGTPQSASALSWKRSGKHSGLILPGQSAPQHRPDREDKQGQLGKRTYTGFNERWDKAEAEGKTKGDRNRRTTDWWHEALEEAIRFYTDYLAHLKHTRDKGGLLLDEEGEPLGFMVNTEALKEAHFAAWPRKLVEPMVLSSTSPYACPHCRAPWERLTEKQREHASGSGKAGNVPSGKRAGGTQARGEAHDIRMGPVVTVETVGWQPTCTCEGNDGSGKCIVLDFFNGSGRTGMVAKALGRAYIGSELNPAYIDITKRQILGPLITALLQTVPEEPEGPKQVSLFDALAEQTD